MNMSKIFKQWIVPLFFITAGAVLAAFALEEFLVPFTILDGGIVGVSMIISQLSRLRALAFSKTLTP